MNNRNFLKIEEVLNRWTDKIYPSGQDFLEKLKTKNKLTIYHGIDPTSPRLHLGHSTNFFLLRKLQELGHKIILLVGDFTAQIGDPTGRNSARKPLDRNQILENCKTYQNQAGKILDFKAKKNPVQIKFNSQWLSRLKLEEVVRLAANFTHGQMIKRNMFQKRIEKREEIYLHEFLYPLFQGYDSVALNADLEVGGTDQTFNMLIGRDLVKIYQNKEKFVITTPLLINPKTEQKLMSKSRGGYIALNDSSKEMFGKVMALSDETIVPCLKFCTEISEEEINKTEIDLDRKRINPRDLKIKLAREIVKIYHGEKAALEAEKEFNNIFKEKKLPTKIPEVKITENKINILDLLVKTKIASSKAETKRLILQAGVKIDNEVQNDWQKIIEIKKGMVIQAGKRKFVKLS